MPQVHLGSATQTNYEPFMAGQAQEGEVSWIRSAGSDSVDLKVGLWRATPEMLPDSFPVTFAGAETLHVLDGELEITVGSAETVRLTPGDICSFEKGTDTRWRVRSPFKALMVIADGGGQE